MFSKSAKTNTFKAWVNIIVFLAVVISSLIEWPFLPFKTTFPLFLNKARAQITQYTSGSGTYTVPAGATQLIVELWGAGGGGAGGGGANGDGNGGGGGGGYTKKTISSPGASYSYSVGAAGTGGAGGAVGVAGSNTTFNGTYIAGGGRGGNYTAGGGGTGGVGGSGSGGDVHYTGGTGGTGSGSYSGGGGGGAGSTGAGGNASGVTAGTGTSANGGDGGAGYSGNTGSGSPGNSYGGGGGSSVKAAAGADGAGGLVQITAYAPPIVTTSEPSSVSYTTATLNGNVTSAGYPTPVTRRGFCYKVGTSGDCTTADTIVYEDGSFTTGTYTRNISGLTSGTGYRVRAYAVNSTGTAYGTTVQLTTSNYSPTTALNSPDDAGSTSDPTPTFNFTATDAESNLVEYNFQLDTTTTFDSQIGGLPLLNRYSDTDGGFTGVGPYSSGSAVEFTVQSGDSLSPGVYYWRVQAIDPAGSNTYGGFPMYRTLTITDAGHTLSGFVYSTSNEGQVYDCSSNNLTIYVRVNGSGTWSALCDQNTGAWQVTGVTGSSGQTVYVYIYGESVKGSTAYVWDYTDRTAIPVIIDRVVVRDDVNGSLSVTEVLAGNTADSDDLITTSGSDLIVGSAYELHIYTGDTLTGVGGNITTGKIHLVGNLNISLNSLTLTGSGTGTSRPLYEDTGTFTTTGSVAYQGTSTTDISSVSYAVLTLNPTISSGVTYNFMGPTSVNGNFTINPTASSSYSLSVNLGGNFVVTPSNTITIQGTTSGIGILNTTASNYTIYSGKIDIQSGGILTANDSNMYLTGTSGTIFTKTGTFNQGTSAVYFQQTAGTPTLTSGTITFYDLIFNITGGAGSSGGNITTDNNLTLSAGELSIPSTYTLTIGGNTDITGSLTITSTGIQTFTGTTTINNGGTYTDSNSGGRSIFTGLLTIAEGGTFDASLINTDVYLYGGLANSGTFLSGNGTYTFSTNNQSISGSAATTFSGTFALGASVTVTNQNTNTVTIYTTSVGGSNTYVNSMNTTTDFKGDILFVLDATASPNTIYYTGGTGQYIRPTTYHHLYIQPSVNSASDALSVGTYTINGNLTIGNGTNTGVVVTAATGDPNISVTGNVTVNGNTTFTGSDLSTATLDIDGNLTISGTFTAPAGTSDTTFTLAGNFIKTGTFNHGSGQLTLTPTTTTQLDYSSDTTFYQLSVLSASAGKNIQFDEGYTTNIANDITIQGSGCSTGLINLDSMVNDDLWAINIQTGATQNIDYVSLEDADGSASQTTPVADSSTQTGSNPGWTVNEGLCAPESLMLFEGLNVTGININ